MANARSSIVSYGAIFKEAAVDFMDDKAMRLGAALAYYTIFSLAPLLVIAIGVTGWFFGKSSSTYIEDEVAKMVGEQGGKVIQAMVDAAASRPKGGMIATVVGIGMLLFGAAGVFGQLQDALNTIWKVAPKPGRGIWGLVRDRFLSFTMVAGICFLLLVSLMVSAALSAFDHFFGHLLPGWGVILGLLNFLVSIGVVTLLFAMMYKWLPDVRMSWRDVWMGAVVTAILFAIGKWALGMYLGRAGVSSAYGAAGSVVVLLLWIYYAAQIFLAGAEFTHVYAIRRGSKPVVAEQAVAMTDEMRSKQGMPTGAMLQEAARETERQGAKPTQRPGERRGGGVSATIAFIAGWIVGQRRGRAP